MNNTESQALRTVELFTDGACSGNPGPGGWGAVLRFAGHEKELSGGERDTTNNRMELMAAIAGLEALREPCAVTLTSDSKYLVDSVNKNWLAGWQKKGWRRSNNEPVLNIDLWQRLLVQLGRHRVTLNWVRGHNGHPENERCDTLAVGEISKYTPR